jgi:tetratricopeptide (TPR) repeat protein
MKHSRLGSLVTGFAVVALVTPQSVIAAESPRDFLMSAAFATSDRATALARIDAALKAANALLARNPADYEARLQRAVAISYRGKLTRSRGDLVAAREAFEALVSAQPRDAEAQMALAGWNLGAVIELGSFMARTALGARRATGMQALRRSVALAGGRPLFPAFASLTLIQLDPDDVAQARRLAEAAVQDKAASPIDRIMQHQAAMLIPLLREGNGKAAAKAAARLLPFGALA